MVVHLDTFDWKLSEGQMLTRHSTVEHTWVHRGWWHSMQWGKKASAGIWPDQGRVILTWGHK